MRIDFIDINKHLAKIDLEHITIDELKEIREKTKHTHLIYQEPHVGYVEFYIQQDWNSNRLIPEEYRNRQKTYFYVKSDCPIEL